MLFLSNFFSLVSIFFISIPTIFEFVKYSDQVLTEFPSATPISKMVKLFSFNFSKYEKYTSEYSWLALSEPCLLKSFVILLYTNNALKDLAGGIQRRFFQLIDGQNYDRFLS